MSPLTVFVAAFAVLTTSNAAVLRSRAFPGEVFREGWIEDGFSYGQDQTILRTSEPVHVEAPEPGSNVAGNSTKLPVHVSRMEALLMNG